MIKIAKKYPQFKNALAWGLTCTAFGVLFWGASVNPEGWRGEHQNNTEVQIRTNLNLEKFKQGTVPEKEEIRAHTLSKTLIKEDPFAALAIKVEHLPETAYRDSGGVNVGAGYCVTKRMASKEGKVLVKKELTEVGFSEFEVEALMNVNASQEDLKRIKVTEEQSLKLLAIVKSEYEKIARFSMGSLFDEVNERQKAVLTYMAYNVGYGLQGFSGLKGMIEKAIEGKAVGFEDWMKAMSPQFRTHKGVKTNYRLGFWAALMWKSEEKFEHAIGHSDVLERLVARRSTPSLRGLAFAQQRERRQKEDQMNRDNSEEPIIKSVDDDVMITHALLELKKKQCLRNEKEISSFERARKSYRS